MSEVEHLATVIEQHFSNPKESSFAHFVTVTDGLTGEQAATVPAPRFNSVWAVVNHVAFWMDVTRTAIKGQPVDLQAWDLTEMGKGWPPLGEVSDTNWLAARQRALDINRAFAEAIRTLDEVSLNQPTETVWGNPPYQMILAMYSHNSYHTAEILAIRHMQSLWVDHKWT